jgi:hypothetical protein
MALQRAMALEERYFGKPLVRRFLRALGVYPPGTTVELSNRQPAMVTAAGGDPWRPQVRILRGARSGRRVELKDMNALEGRHQLSIVRAILPPLLVLADAPLPDVADDAPEEEAPLVATLPRAAAGPSSNEVARQQLAHMDNLLEALDDISLHPMTRAPGPAVSIPPAPPNTQPPLPTSTSWPPPQAIPPAASTGMSYRPPPNAAPPPRQTPSAMPPRRSSSALPPPLRPSAVPPPPPAPSRLDRNAVPSLAVPATDLERFSLDPRGAFVLRFVDGTATVAEILDASGQPDHVVLGILEMLLARGVIRFR